jgi:hypothetical protein
LLFNPPFSQSNLLLLYLSLVEVNCCKFSKDRRLPPPATTAFVAFPCHHQPLPLHQNTPPPDLAMARGMLVARAVAVALSVGVAVATTVATMVAVMVAVGVMVAAAVAVARGRWQGRWRGRW